MVAGDSTSMSECVKAPVDAPAGGPSGTCTRSLSLGLGKLIFRSAAPGLEDTYCSCKSEPISHEALA